MIRRSIRVCEVVVALVFATWCSAQSQQQKLELGNELRLVDCHPVTAVPCFRGDLNLLDAQGAPAAMSVETQGKLLSALHITADGLPVTLFYASTGSSTGAVHGRTVLILIDISGSMNRKLKSGETRFAAARNALIQFLDSFQDGVDEVAIVPFESHQVVDTIRSATFATTREQAAAEVENLSVPKGRNNTALYSAVVTGLDVLNAHIGTKASEAMLVVMTDGKNEVFPGDDQGLLSGESGLGTAERTVKSSKIPVVGIGFGELHEIDEEALRRISTRPPSMAPDAATLKQIFGFARKLLVNRIDIAFLSPKPDLASLAGQSINFQATLDLPGGSNLTSNPVPFDTPKMGIPLLSGKATLEELKALNEISQPPGPSWLQLLRPLFVFLGLGGVLLIAWFGLPRLIWPGQYIGNMGAAAPVKWSSLPQANKKAPPGFEPGKIGAGERRPQDATVVQPYRDSTKTRIQQGFRK